jgi:WD40 repeat protein
MLLKIALPSASSIGSDTPQQINQEKSVAPRRNAIRAVILRAVLPTLAVGCLAVPVADAQFISFGKNKVHYTDFQWHVMKGEHFDLYFYPEERLLAEKALALAESSYVQLSVDFVHHISRRIPLIIYASHQDFEQTNVTPYLLPEGVAGLTEFAKGRVLIPFNGSYSDFRDVIHHEMVHVFQLSKLGQIYGMHPKNAYLSPPLWFDEGLADFLARPWDTEADLFVRDLVLSGRMPDIKEIWRYNGTFVLYKIGQSLCRYIAATYGEDKLALFYDEIWTEDSFAEVIQRVLGVTEERLSGDWQQSLKVAYFPLVTVNHPFRAEGTPLTTKGEANFKGIPVPDSAGLGRGRFLFVSPRSGYTNIYSASLAGPDRDVQVVVRGERSPEFESFHPFRTKIDVTRRGELTFVSKHEERDALYTYDLSGKQLTGSYRFDSLIGLSSPNWSPDGRRIVFSGLTKDGYSDLYILDTSTGGLDRLTDDRYLDADPAWSPDGRWIAFSSDRGGYGQRGARNLFLMDLETREILYLTFGDWNDLAPSWSPDGSRIAFASDRDGTQNLYFADRGGSGQRLTQFLGGAFDPVWTEDGQELIFTGFENQRFHIYRMAIPESPPGPAIALAQDHGYISWNWDGTTRPIAAEVGRYRPQFSLDIAQGGVGFEPNQRLGEGAQAALTDMMGNRILFLQVGNSASRTSDLLSSMNVGVSYFNLAHRLNYGVSTFHYVGDYLDEEGFPFFERRAGGTLVGSYPFSKFHRVESGLSFVYSDKEEPTRDIDRRAFLVSNYFSFVRDTALWLNTGPIDGQRMNVTVGLSLDASRASAEGAHVLLDYRRYFRASLRSAYAVRLQGRVSGGTDPPLFLLGGTHSLRGYPRRALIGTRAVLINNEYRFPLIEHFIVGFPFGRIDFPGIQGAVFLDAAQVWSGGDARFDPEGSTGFGVRMGLGGFLVLRMDFARRTDFRSMDDNTRTEFYIGWNY